ncbi:hypothetical protein ONS95_013915 [Cadophora gregata]|uniref:uncharacterized protein n=1 Tax=Cadophora gregata TaxID=51156 RepID=UPI0026DAF843|nr:uncharacterized protein ONS95_013915 [Cadophora gregata]KAK0114424.1 hypothetical protein ONS95_013915 [Cadophora gregata]
MIGIDYRIHIWVWGKVTVDVATLSRNNTGCPGVVCGLVYFSGCWGSFAPRFHVRWILRLTSSHISKDLGYEFTVTHRVTSL